jgi:uncharacterized membrane protein YqgA involved in biofilm formation
MIGTLVNVAAVVAGGSIGIIFRKRLPQKTIEVVFQGIGLVTLCIGISMFLKSQWLLVVVLSILVGGVVGGLLRLNMRIQQSSADLRKHVKIVDEKFSEGLITSFLLFCMGAMTILGSIDEGLGNGSELLITKSILDGFASIALAAGLGAGVIFSIVPLFIFQGGITLLAFYAGSFFDTDIVNELSATGGVLLVGLGLNILNVTKIKVMDLLPAIIFAIIFGYLYKLYFVNLVI